MLTISPALSASQATEYHREEFANGRSNYYAEEGAVLGEWHGRLARDFGLNGSVQEEHFERLAKGQHPETGDQLVQHKSAHEYINSRGENVRTVDHRAGFDMCFSAPKSMSLTALVGGDDRVRDAHRESVGVALDELERYTQSRIGGNFPAVTTGEWIVAKFEHDTARPVDGYAAPQLHTHCVLFNITRTEDGKTRALQPLEIFRSQQYATAIYRSELASRLQRMGYALDQGRYGQPEIRGYTAQYLDVSSPRRQQIVQQLEQHGFSGAAAAQIAAHQTRDRKQTLSRTEVLAQHRQLAAEHGNQPERVVAAALRVDLEVDPKQMARRAASGVLNAERRIFERTSVTDERALLADALNHSQGYARLPEVREAMQDRMIKGDFIEMSSNTGGMGREFTTREMREHEQRNIDLMRAGRGKCAALVGEESRRLAVSQHAHLSESQRAAVDTVLTNRDRFVALEGRAGTGKTTSLAAIREAAVLAGYEVQGLAPTSRAAKKLAEAGMKTETLQMHLTRGQRPGHGQKRLYIMDESSLTGTRQMRELLERVQDADRVILVGDTRQHEAIEAGRPYAQLQEAGLQTALLSEIVRQKDSALKSVVEDLYQGNVRSGFAKLKEQGRIHEIDGQRQRIETITAVYLDGPENTLVVSPDNRSRCEINESIHSALQVAGRVERDQHTINVLVARQDMTAVDRQQAVRYAENEVIRYTRGSEKMGIRAGEYARVTGIDRDRNLLTVERESSKLFIYDPRRLSGVQVYENAERHFASNDRIQITAPYREMGLANREMGKVEQIGADGTLCLKLDDGREVRFNVAKHPHLDYGYAVTSFSSQGQTCERVLINIDSDNARGKLLNSRFAYVSVSRAEYDVQIYTNDKDSLAMHLSRDVSQRSAIECYTVNEFEIKSGMEEHRKQTGQDADLGISSRVQCEALAQAPAISLGIG